MSGAKTPEIQELDTSGTVCPLPILMAAKAMMGLVPGDILVLRGDDPAIAEDMPIFCVRAGHRLLEMKQEDGLVICRIEKLTYG